MPEGRVLIRVLAGLYTFALLLFSLSSILLVWADDPLLLLPLEVAVDGALVAGCVLFVMQRRVDRWRWVLAGAVAGQFVLLAVSEPPRPCWPDYSLELAAVLGPAVALNLATAGLLGFSGSMPKRSQ